ncbi:MAG: glycosyltransferase family 2 protein [Kistimonas sp.]|nr:glycosyltransferase family 2 protein [Kistimonas sp.]
MTDSTPSISVCIIAKNAMPRIKDTLESVKWADEIVVLDSGSTDDTVAVSKEYTKHVYQTDWPGFGVQFQRAMDKGSSDWLLSVDADEVVTPELKQEILDAIRGAGAGVDAFAMPRRSHLCNTRIFHSSWYPDYVPRVFRRGAVRYTTDLVHPRPVVSGALRKLRSDLLHYPYDTVDALQEKAAFYSTLWAEDKYSKGKRASLRLALGKALWTFIRVWVIRRGFLDGRYGFIIAMALAGGTWSKYMKLACKSRECEHRS